MTRGRHGVIPLFGSSVSGVLPNRERESPLKIRRGHPLPYGRGSVTTVPDRLLQIFTP
jgi:hypothetical protein